MELRGSFFCFNHQGKAKKYVEALAQAGYRQTVASSRSMFCLTDLDVLGRLPALEIARSRGAKVFVYPHAARPAIQWDGIHEPWEHTTATFVAAQGHVDIMQAYGYPKPLHVAGWSYCPLHSFRPSSTGSTPPSVLFAPIHPNGNGYLCALDKKINYATLTRLAKLHRSGSIQLTVRYLRGLAASGIWEEPGVKYVVGRPDLSFSDIEHADVVVSHQTFAYIAVARGKPTVMMAEYEAPRSGNSPEKLKRVASWHKYKDLLMYPLDILAAEDPMAVLEEAMKCDEKIADWRRRIIGEPFNGKKFTDVVESYL